MVRISKMTLEERYKGEPGLLSFYQRKLLEPGWAGELDSVELAYIKSELRQSASGFIGASAPESLANRHPDSRYAQRVH